MANHTIELYWRNHQIVLLPVLVRYSTSAAMPNSSTYAHVSTAPPSMKMMCNAAMQGSRPAAGAAGSRTSLKAYGLGRRRCGEWAA